MCLIIASPVAESLSRHDIEDATSMNPDGFGIAWAEAGRVRIAKYDQLGIDSQCIMLRRLSRKGLPWVAHWRFATHGRVCQRLAHPFRLSHDAAIAHNGIVATTPKAGESDTLALVRELIAAGHNSASSAIDALAKIPDVTRGSMFASIDGTGEIFTLGGTWDGNLWHSNTQLLSWQKPASGAPKFSASYDSIADAADEDSDEHYRQLTDDEWHKMFSK